MTGQLAVGTVSSADATAPTGAHAPTGGPRAPRTFFSGHCSSDCQAAGGGGSERRRSAGKDNLSEDL